MAKLNTGAAIQKWRVKNGKRVREWHACISFYRDGKRVRQVQKPKENTKTAARELAKEMVAELQGQGEQAISGANMTFA